MYLPAVIFWAAILGFIPGKIAQKKGHSFGSWWLFGALLFIIALPMALLLTPNAMKLESDELKSGGKRCPYCAEVIKAEAVVCRHCHRDVPALSSAY